MVKSKKSRSAPSVSIQMFRTRLLPLKQSNRPHVATPAAQTLGQLDKGVFQHMLEEGTLNISPSLSNPTDLYEILDVETEPSVSIGFPPNMLVNFRSKHEGTTEGMMKRIADLETAAIDLRTRISTLEQEVKTLQEEARTAKAVSVDWQVWSRAQDAVDELIFEAERTKCIRYNRTLGFSSAQELRNAINLPTAANHAAAQTIVAGASSQLRDAALAIRVAKRQLEAAGMALAHPLVTVADLRRVVADDISTAILAEIETSRRAGIRRFL